MPEIIQIHDGGFGIIEHDKKSINVGKIIFRISENESKPIDHIAYCKPAYKESIIKNLKLLCFPLESVNKEKKDAVSETTYKMHAESLVDVFLFLENIRSQIKYFVVNSIPGHPHVEVIFDTELPFDEIKRELESIYNAHVMADTVQPIEKYTGERK